VPNSQLLFTTANNVAPNSTAMQPTGTVPVISMYTPHCASIG